MTEPQIPDEQPAEDPDDGELVPDVENDDANTEPEPDE